MMKKILLSIILTITLFMGIAISSMPVEASGNELTSEYVFTNADYKAATNLAGVTNSFMFDGGFEGQVYHSKDIPIKGYTANLGVMFKLGVNITVKPSTENNKLISFSVIKASNDVIKSTMENAVMTLNNVEITDRFISDNGGYITTYTPIDPTQEMKITFNDEENRVYSFLITYSLPTVEKVTDGSFDTLAAAIEKDNIEEIIVTKTIMCNRADRDFILDAKNKIIRAEITGVDESGMIQAGSTVELINVIKNASATIKNATILGGSRSAILNRGNLYLENVNIMRSGNYTATNYSAGNYSAYGGIYNGDTGKLVMKNCNISRNVSKYGGAIYNDEGLVILDGCSLTENRSNIRGGAIYCAEGSELVLNNTVIANNATVTVNSSSEGGAIYANQSNTYIMNSTIVGNASSYYKINTDPSTFGGGLTIWKGNLYAVNSIITDNYAFDNGVPVESDIVATLNNDIPNMFLYNNIYKVITTEGVTEDSSNNYQLENMSSIEEIFASYQTSGNISGDGSTNTIAFEKPILVSILNGRVCVPTDKNCDLVENGIKTYIAYTAERKGGLFYLSYMKDGVNTKLGKAYDISENEVTTFINGEERTNSIIGSTNSTGIKYRIIKGINSNSEAGTISGVSTYGNSYEYGSLVTVTAIPNEGYEFDYWMDETGTILSSQKEYTFEALKNITITPVWISTANAGNVTVSNLTCNAVVYSNSRSIKLNNLNLEVGNKIEGLYLNDTKVADENLFLLPNISGITDENGQWIATEDVVLTANIVPTLAVISTTGYSGTYDGYVHEITVEAISPKDIVYNWYFNGSLIEGANTPTLNVTNVLESGNYYCLLTSIINGEEVSVRTETIIVDIKAIKVAIPTINNDTYTYNGLEQSVEFTGIQSCMTVTGDKATNAGNYEVIISLDSNYAWEESFNGKFAWTIEKADCDLSYIKFEDLTVSYNGNKQVIEIIGALPEGVEASYTNNEGIDVNTYEATVEFVSINYNVEGIKLTSTLTIVKAQAEITVDTKDINVIYGDTIKLPEATTNFGEVVVTKSEMVNVGEYTVTYSVAATENYDGDIKVVKVIISPKAVAEPTVKGSYTYIGTEQTVEINGLESFMTITSGNKATDAGNYVVVITLDDNYVWAEGLNGKVEWSIVKAQAEITVDTKDINVIYGDEINLPEATTNFGEVVVTKSEMVNVGEYIVTYSVAATENYDGDIKVVKVIISPKAVAEPTVTGSYTYIGTEQTVEINGLESFMTITSGNKATDAGNYVVVIELDNNHVWAEGLDGKVEWSINKDQDYYVNPETNLKEVIVSSNDGIDPNKSLFVELIEMLESTKDFSEFLEGNQKVAVAYDIKLLLNNQEVPPDSTLTFKILIPEDLRNRDFEIMHIHNSNEKSMIEFEIEGNYVVFTTDKLSEFVFVYEMGSLLWLIIVLVVITVLEVGLLVFLLNKKKQAKTMQLASVYPPFIFGMFLPETHLVLVIILAIAVVALTITDLIFAFDIYGDKIKLFFKKGSNDLNNNVEEQIIEEQVAEESQLVGEQPTEILDDTEDSTLEDDVTIENVRITKGFLAKLIQSNPEVKGYYDIIKNELLSFKKVKSKINFKNEVFKLGKDVVAKLVFRGKTLCLYLALNPADYENTKYKIEDMSGVSSGETVPTMYRISLPRRANYAKELICDLMKKHDAEKKDIDFIEYSKNYPYEDDEVLIEKGLIRKNVIIIGNGSTTVTVINRVNIVRTVNASEVNNLISDEQVVDFVEQSTRIADRTKKVVINIDTISQYFNENETVTLEEIKKRVPNFNKKATYYKVLANGTLDKPLTVDADDFSIEAEKMIIVTGGKVLVSKSQ